MLTGVGLVLVGLPVAVMADPPAMGSANLVFHLDASDLDGDTIEEGLSEGGLSGTSVDTWADKTAGGNGSWLRHFG